MAPRVPASSRSPWARRIAAFGLVVLLAVGATGCASKPTMHLNHAEMNGVRLGFPPSLSVVMTIFVDVYNPNSYDVAIRAMRGETTLGNGYVLPINVTYPGEGVWLPSERTTQMHVQLVVPLEIGLGVISQAFSAVTIPYHFRGRADVTATRSLKIEKDDYEVDEVGAVSRQQIEAAVRGF